VKFQFKVIETNVGTVELEAENYEAALEKTNEAYFQGQVTWDDAEVQITFDKSWEEEE
jgi:hypothetical protein